MAKTEIGELQVLITAQADKFNSEISKVQKQVGSLEKSLGKSTKSVGAMGIAMGNILANAVSAGFRAIASQMDEAVGRLDTLNNYPKVMSNLGISAEDAEKSINKLSDKLTGLPTSLSDAALAVQRFTSANSNIGASTDMYLALNNAILAGGASAEVQATAMEQISQAYAKNKPDMIEWRSLMNAMPAQLKQIATAMNYASSEQLGEDLRNGEVSMNDFMKTVMRLNNEGVDGFQNFEEQARNATGGVQTSITNLKIAIQRGIANIMDVIGQSNIAGFFNKVASVIGTVSNYIAAFVRIVKEAVAWLNVLFGGKGSTADLVKETQTAGDNIQSGAGSAGELSDNLDDAGKAAKKLNNQLASFDEMNVLREQDNSSSGSGSGSGGAGGLGSNFDFGDDSDISKTEDKIKELAEKMKKWFKDAFNFDWDKIGKAMKRFWDDIKKGAEPIKKIVGDVWNDYLKPLVSWAGNSLLPGVLNAIGGAIQVVGSVLGTFWSSFLKPFIDEFLVPIAKWTGGVVVDVLNWIGESLRGLASNQTAVSAIASSMKLLFEVFAAYKTVQLATTAMDAFRVALSGLGMHTSNIVSQMSSTMLIAGSATNNMEAMAGAAALAGTKFAGLGSTLSSIATAVFSPTTIIVLGLVAAFEAVQLAVGIFNLKQQEAEVATNTYRASLFTEKQTTDELNNAVQAQIDLKNELLGIQKTLADSQIALLQAQDNLNASQSAAEEIAQKYGMSIDEAKKYVDNLDLSTGNLSEKDRELADVILDLQSKEGTLKEAQDKVSESKAKQTEKSEELMNQAWKEHAMAKLQEAQMMVNEGRYNDVAEAMESLTKETIEYTDENGNSCRLTKEQMRNMAEFVGDRLGMMEGDNSKTWKNIWHDANGNIENVKGAIDRIDDRAYESGANVSKGIKSGMENNSGGIFSTIGNIASGLIGKFKNILGIQSPSKVMAEAGKFIDEGLARGISKNQGTAIDSMKELAEATLGTFSDFDVETDLNARLGKMTTSALESATSAMSLDLEPEPVHVVVNVGDEKLVDKVIGGINDASFLNNRCVINF